MSEVVAKATDTGGSEKERGSTYSDYIIASEGKGASKKYYTAGDILKKIRYGVVSDGLTLAETSEKLTEVIEAINEANRNYGERGSGHVRDSGEYDNFIFSLGQYYSPTDEEANERRMRDSEIGGAYPIGEPFGFDRCLNNYLSILINFFRNKGASYTLIRK